MNIFKKFVSFIAILLYICVDTHSSAMAQTAEWQWAKTFSQEDNSKIDEDNSGESIGVDKQGNITLITRYNTTVRIPDNSTPIYSKTFFDKIDSDGLAQSSRQIGSSAVTNDHIVGDFVFILQAYGQMQLTASPLTEPYETLWQRYISSGGLQKGGNICFDNQSNILLTANFFYPFIYFQNDTVYNNGAIDLFTVKYDKNGNEMWVRPAGGKDVDNTSSIAADSLGNSYIAGSFYSDSITFGNTVLKHPGGNDLFLVKYDTNGETVWAKTFGNFDTNTISAMCTDTSGNIIIAGYFLSGIFSFDTLTLTNHSPNTFDVFIVKIRPDGKILWGKSFGGSSNDKITSLYSDTKNNFYIAGNFSSPVLMFDSTSTMNNGGTDIYIAKFNQDGKNIWAKSVGGSKNDEVADMAIDANNSIIITGNFSSPVINFGNTTLKNSYTKSNVCSNII